MTSTAYTRPGSDVTWHSEKEFFVATIGGRIIDLLNGDANVIDDLVALLKECPLEYLNDVRDEVHSYAELMDKAKELGI